jgi:hypothetical protein
LQQISRLLGFSHSAQQGSEVLEVVVAETAAIKKKSSGDVRRKEGDQRRGNNVANASVGRKIGARRIRVGGLGAWRWREESFIFLNSKKER